MKIVYLFYFPQIPRIPSQILRIREGNLPEQKTRPGGRVSGRQTVAGGPGGGNEPPAAPQAKIFFNNVFPFRTTLDFSQHRLCTLCERNTKSSPREARRKFLLYDIIIFSNLKKSKPLLAYTLKRDKRRFPSFKRAPKSLDYWNCLAVPYENGMLHFFSDPLRPQRPQGAAETLKNRYFERFPQPLGASGALMGRQKNEACQTRQTKDLPLTFASGHF